MGKKDENDKLPKEGINRLEKFVCTFMVAKACLEEIWKLYRE